MEFGFNQEQQRFRQEVRDFCQNEPWGEIAREIDEGYSPSLYRKVAKKGWLGLQFPERYGGQGKGPIYGIIFAEEVGYSGVPTGAPYMISITTLEFGNLILKYGNEQQKEEYLPRIIKGEITAGQAFTEPEAGADLASIQTRAARQGHYYIVDGQKMFTSFIHVPNGYSILMARTDPHASPERGISLFILDNNTPGISYTPLVNMRGGRTNQVFLDNVKISKDNLLGEENKGWDYFMQTKVHYWTKALPYRVGSMQRMFDSLIQYTKETQSNGHPLSQNSPIRQKLAEMAIDLKVIRLLTYRLAWMLSKDLDALDLAAITKVFSSEAILRFSNSAMQILGLYGQLQRGSGYAPLTGSMERRYRGDASWHSVDGGVCATRNFIATHGLGLPEL
jgi:alkylation response protein AidB-like acyl-CoA dehydrogenase